MKKLLLVLLVPFLVLGVMGCGKGFETGSESPIGLQGGWKGSDEATVTFVLTASQATVYDGNSGRALNFVTEFSGPIENGLAKEGEVCTLTFLDYVTGEEVGSLKFKATNDGIQNDAITLEDLADGGRKVEKEYQDWFLPSYQDYER
jgi:hypothetical protein